MCSSDLALPDMGVFGAMKQMVATLKNKIDEANQKSQKAAQESEKARAATAEAEDARQQAERAKAEGMLQAARQLEGIVQVVSSALRNCRLRSSSRAVGPTNSQAVCAKPLRPWKK